MMMMMNEVCMSRFSNCYIMLFVLHELISYKNDVCWCIYLVYTFFSHPFIKVNDVCFVLNTLEVFSLLYYVVCIK